jgi:Spy/CpxP family protein refolding chaperone
MMMTRFGLLGMLALGLVVAGCASSTSSAPPADSAPRTRCLNDRNETGSTRPIFFLFCAESP